MSFVALVATEPKEVEDPNMARRPANETEKDEVSDLKAEIAELRISLARKPRNDWSRVIQALTVVVSVSALIFAAGGWWTKTSAMETRLATLENVVQQVVKQQADQKTDSALLSQQVNQLLTITAKIEGATVVAPRGNSR